MVLKNPSISMVISLHFALVTTWRRHSNFVYGLNYSPQNILRSLKIAQDTTQRN